MKDYHYAIKVLYKLLELAWGGNSQLVETLCYDLLSVCYFSIGNLKKSEFYMTRYLRGV